MFEWICLDLVEAFKSKKPKRKETKWVKPIRSVSSCFCFVENRYSHIMPRYFNPFIDWNAYKKLNVNYIPCVIGIRAHTECVKMIRFSIYCGQFWKKKFLSWSIEDICTNLGSKSLSKYGYLYVLWLSLHFLFKPSILEQLNSNSLNINFYRTKTLDAWKLSSKIH